jgi:hypothetical protein
MPLWTARGQLGWAEALAVRGDSAAAREHAARALELSREHGYGAFESRAAALVESNQLLKPDTLASVRQSVALCAKSMSVSAVLLPRAKALASRQAHAEFGTAALHQPGSLPSWRFSHGG